MAAALDKGVFVVWEDDFEAPKRNIWLRALAGASFGTPAKKPDINNDGKVDAKDLGILFSDWGKTDQGNSDLNEDGKVDEKDFVVLKQAWNP